MFDIYADDCMPTPKEYAKVYSVGVPWDKQGRTPEERMHVYVEVDTYNQVSLSHYTYWFGKDIKDWGIRREIYDWLVEWELAEWQQIGPEDSELFATEKLTDDQSRTV